MHHRQSYTSFLLLISIVIAFFQTSYCTACCKSPWIGFQRHCYMFQTDTLKFQNAEDQCRSVSTSARHAHLASITSENENIFILETFREIWPEWVNETRPSIWIGYHDRYTEGQFQWTDIGRKQYTNWNPEEPNDFRGKEDCSAMWVDNNDNGRWNDLRCNNINRFVCKIPQHV
ncbi:echinoidin-like [Amphiura filiformis]|uniref:echinoidin-like n=1 Tax=Amphiura filiformis TaxID=82378 RepID=UPI003B20C5F8